MEVSYFKEGTVSNDHWITSYCPYRSYDLIHIICNIWYVTYQLDHMVHMSGKFRRNIIFHTIPKTIHESMSEVLRFTTNHLSVSESVQESEVLTLNSCVFFFKCYSCVFFWILKSKPRFPSESRVNLSVQVYLRKSYHTILNIILYYIIYFLDFSRFSGFCRFWFYHHWNQHSFLPLLTCFHVILIKFSINYRYFISRKRESPKTGQDDRNRQK